MNQRMLAGFEKYKKVTRRAQFLSDMQSVVPWDKLIGLVRPHYPKLGEQGGRPPIPLERMLRVYCLQLWFNLSDPAVEEALYDVDSMRRFVGIDLGAEAPPDETTICKFRHFLEQHDLSGRVLKVVNRHLASRGITVKNGTIVDATIIDAPSSTKNQDGERDPEMHQAKTGRAVVFRHEDARWRRQPDEDHPYSAGLRRQCRGQGCSAAPAAWERDPSVGRSSVPGAR